MVTIIGKMQRTQHTSLWTFRIGNGTIQIHLPPLFRALLLLVTLNLWLHLLWLLVILPPLSASAVLLLMWSPHLNLFLLPRPAALLLLMRPAPDLVLLLLLLRPMHWLFCTLLPRRSSTSRPRIVRPVLRAACLLALPTTAPLWRTRMQTLGLFPTARTGP